MSSSSNPSTPTPQSPQPAPKKSHRARNLAVVVIVVIILALGGFFVYNYTFHVLGGPVGNGTALCTSYLRGNCDYDATYSSSTNQLTVYGVGQIIGSTMYNVGFAYAPAADNTNSQGGPIGVVFQADNSLSGNVLKSGATIKTVTVDVVNASAPSYNGYNGDLYVAYATSSSGADCVGPTASLTGCSFYAIAQITLK